MPPSFGCDDGMLANFWLCAAGGGGLCCSRLSVRCVVQARVRGGRGRRADRDRPPPKIRIQEKSDNDNDKHEESSPL
jgi:hypothetical protein